MAAHRPAQLVRLGATVVAGTASLCLTFAAGAYIVNNMPTLAPPGGSEQSAPLAAPDPGQARPLPAGTPAPRATGALVELAAFSTERVAEQATVHQSGVGATPDYSSLAGRVRVGNTYVGAQVVPARSDAVAFTLDTNLGTIASKYLGITADPAGVTALRTEFDTRRGGVVFVLTDPTLGTHTLHVQRIQKPGTVAPADPAPAPQPGTVAPADSAPAPQPGADDAPAAQSPATDDATTVGV
ncbi:hypothetical protein ACFXK0_03325 [Nocardia sp. NPDC059177]|uniref:hypothetical protein n=1 Tax=Nocardia sp. NPDC059177 TaxID=3346759 RepID=UPI0036AF6EB3